MTPPHGISGPTMLVLPDYADPPTEVVEAWLSAALAGLSQPLRLQAALVVLELVASARTCGSAPFVVRLWVTGSGRALAISVDDCTPAHNRTAPDGDLLLVAGLSTQWGVEQRAGGRTLWALISSKSGSTRVRSPGWTPPGEWTQ